MARLLYRVFDKVVPLYKVDEAVLKSVVHGKRIPRSCMTGSPLTTPSLEDYALSPDESRVANESEEFPAILEYIRRRNLEALARPLRENTP